MKKIKAIVGLLLLVVGQAVAEEHLVMHFDFENVEGKNVTDPTSGVTAELMNQAKVEELEDRHVLNLGNGTGYLDMTKNAGSIMKGLTDFTVSVYYCVDNKASLSGAGYFLWCFSQSSANTETSSAYTAYRLNAQRMATSPGGWGSEVGMEVGGASEKGRWVHVLYRQAGTLGELFIDGKRVQTNTTMPVLANTFTAVPAYCWIGRAPFSGDSYLKQTLVSDFRVYDAAVSDDVVSTLAAEATKLQQAYYYGTPGDFTTLRNQIADCADFVASAGTSYAPNAVAELQDIINIATIETEAGRASQTLIDHYTDQLQTLLKTAKATKGYTPKAVFTPTGDYGFRHPGGLVSQDDIDRAKQLLADGDSRMKRAWDILCANEHSQSNVGTWPTEVIVRGGDYQNSMNAAHGAAAAYQNALRWKIGGTKANADAAVRILMAWATTTHGISGGDMSLGSGIYGYEFAQAAELMRDYEGWSRKDFDTFKKWMVRVFYNYAIDFLRRRHDCWSNYQWPQNGPRPGHYWSNWGLCNALCVMSIGILCDDVHMYNQGMSFYKYDHVGTYKDRTNASVILNDGLTEFIGNLIPVVHKDSRGPLGYLGQMQESGRDQGHSLMSVGLSLEICQIGLTQGDDLYAYWNDRIAAGVEFVAAMNYGGVNPASLPWTNYNYADRWGTMGAGWHMTGPNTGGMGEHRPGWDRARGYYEGLRGVKMQYSDAAAAVICPDGGGGNYGQNSGGFDDLGFSTLTNWQPAVAEGMGITPLSGDITYNGTTYKNQTNLGGLKYDYNGGPTKAIPADGSDITLTPQLPEGAEDSGNWFWETGETTRSLTVRADRSHIYRVTYTAPNGAKSQQAFSIAVAGDAEPDVMTNEITVAGNIERITEKTVLTGTSVILYSGPTTGWTDDFLWDNGAKGSVITIPAITTSRSYTCQYANQSGAVSESRFQINVVEAMQSINGVEATETTLLPGSSAQLHFDVPAYADPSTIIWQDGTTGADFTIDNLQADAMVTASYNGQTYTFNLYVKASDYTYYDLLTSERGYTLVGSADELAQLSPDHYFVIASDQGDLLIGLKNAPKNGNKALFFQTPADPRDDLSKLFTIEAYGDAFCLRNVDYDGLLLQTELNAPHNMRTHDQPLACEWTRLLMAYTDGSWTIENGKFPGNYLGLWTPANGYRNGEEIAGNKTGDDEIAHFQIFAIRKKLFHTNYINAQWSTANSPCSITPLLVNPSFQNANGFGWTLSGTWGNQRYNGAAEVWHSENFDISQTITGLPDGEYTVTCQMANGEGSNTGYLYATSGSETQQAVVTQSCKGSDFDIQRNKMQSNVNYGLLSVTIPVTDGSLTLGIKEPSKGNTWLVFDNFTLTYKGSSSDGIQEIVNRQSNNSQCYDLQGRRVNGIAKRGIYIINGKKILMK